eukprot:749217-Hanusia_phi.AAC.7
MLFKSVHRLDWGTAAEVDRQVLDNYGKIRAVRPSDVQPHKKSATAVALDGEQQTIAQVGRSRRLMLQLELTMTQGDVVKVVGDGPMKGKTGTVRHIFRAFLFLYSPARMENAGSVEEGGEPGAGDGGLTVELVTFRNVCHEVEAVRADGSEQAQGEASLSLLPCC